jgi:hypothetical protein
VDSLQGELRKLRPPSFDGEREREDDVEAWLLGLKRYFQLHNYSSNLINMPRMNPRKINPWEKGEDRQSNAGDAKKITYIRIIHMLV